MIKKIKYRRIICLKPTTEAIQRLKNIKLNVDFFREDKLLFIYSFFLFACMVYGRGQYLKVNSWRRRTSPKYSVSELLLITISQIKEALKLENSTFIILASAE